MALSFLTDTSPAEAGLVLLGLALAYCLAQLTAYALALRNLRFFRHEGGILAFQVASFALYSALATAAYFLGEVGEISVLLGVYALHTIYSMLFLILWAICDGSYSFNILREMEKAREAGKVVDDEAIYRFATFKEQEKDRLETVYKLNLGRKTGENEVRISGIGKLIGGVLELVLWFSNLKNKS